MTNMILLKKSVKRYPMASRSPSLDIIQVFQSLLKNPTDLSVPVAAIQALAEVASHSRATTMTEFIKEVDEASLALKRHTNNCISVAAGCELFTRYVTRTASDSSEVNCLIFSISSSLSFYHLRK